MKFNDTAKLKMIRSRLEESYNSACEHLKTCSDANMRLYTHGEIRAYKSLLDSLQFFDEFEY